MIRTPLLIAISTSVCLAAVVGAQPAPIRSAHPDSLLIAPADPLAYFEARDRVRRFVWQREGSLAEIEPLAEQIAARYPLDGANWDLLGRVKDRAGKRLEAAIAYERAGPLIGWGMHRSPGWNAAQSLAAAGEQREALELIRQQIFAGRSLFRLEMFDWDDFDSLRTDPEFRELAGRPDTTGWSRDYGWRRDLEHLVAEVRRVNPEYHAAALPAEFIARRDSLEAAIPKLTDVQILVGMNRMLAALRQGHTSLWNLPRDHPGSATIPVRFFAFADGVYIVAATERYKGLIGSRIMNIGNTTAEEAMRRFGEVQSTESPMFSLLVAPGQLRKIAFLRGLDIIGAGDTVPLTLRAPNGRISRVTLVASHDATVPAYNLLPAPAAVPAPLYLRDQGTVHYEERLPASSAVYVRLLNVADDGEQTLEAFGRRLATSLPESGARNLIVDLRHNTGGKTSLSNEFVRAVVAFTARPENQLYVLIGRGTYSAGANLLMDLERLASPIIVGEPSSQCCSFAGDAAPVRLPYSNASGQLAAVRWNMSYNAFDGRTEISPDVPVVLSSHVYFAGRDPALETIFQMIERRRGGSSTGAEGRGVR